MAQESPRLLSDFTPGLESQHTEWPWAQPGPYGLLKAWQRGRVIQEYGPNLSSCIEKIARNSFFTYTLIPEILFLEDVAFFLGDGIYERVYDYTLFVYFGLHT